MVRVKILKKPVIGHFNKALVFTMLLALVSFSALPVEAHAADYFTITDTAGRTVKIPKKLERIVTGPVVMPNLIFAVDGTGEKIAGMHPMSKSAWMNSILKLMAPELEKAETKFIQGGFKMNIEEVLKLEPDLVFQVSFEKANIEQLEKLGIPVVVTHEGLKELDQYLEKHIELVGRVLGKEERAAELIDDFNRTRKMIAERVEKIPQEKKPKGLILFNAEKLMATGTGSFANFWLSETGAVNVAAEIKTSPRGSSVNMEQIMVWNPDVIFITNFCPTRPEDILENKIPGQDWRSINAVKNGRVYKIPLGEYRWYPPSGDSSLMLKWTATKIHPDLFKDLDIKEEIKAHFKKIYNYELNDKQVEKILNPSTTGAWREK